ncbi:cathepsin G-like [Alligator mississippiensis]|uniref:cathepsin G-like n=1 Tax=Alligator mississippiensis TaxID=8496 RepID=UPI002877A175|nr:cathepsin G-like [Alligator mississippiensis]
MLMLLLFVLPTALLLHGAGADEIIGGRIVKKYSRPYMAYTKIEKTEKVNSKCGGFLIQEDVVVTAAHCNTEPRHLSKMSVILGAHNIRKPEPNSQQIKVRRWIPHPQFNRTISHCYDIMLLLLKHKARLNKQVQTIPLPAWKKNVKPGTMCSVAGWGRIHLWSNKSSDVLLEVDLRVQDDRICRKCFPKYSPQVQMCVGDSSGKRSTFKGDSGGPLVCNGTAYGIVSYGPHGKTFPEVFAKVSSFIPWIKEELKKLHS